MEFDVSTESPRASARIIKSAVTPRPIAWISTTGETGVDNLAPYSSYNYVSSEQPVVVFNSPNEDHGGLKDTARNVLDTGEFVVNVVTESVIEQMDTSSERLPPTESEFDATGVTRAETKRVDPPRVAEAAISLECTLYDSHEVHDRLMVLGDVRYIHVDDDVLTDGKVDMRNLPTVGRLGGPYYTVSEPVDFERQF